MTDTNLLSAADSSQLVIIDEQARLASAMPEADRTRVLRNTGILLRGAAILGVTVLCTEQYPKGLGPTEEPVRGLIPAGMPTVEKTCFSCHRSGEFRATLEAVDRPQVILTGMETHVCVLQTALELHGAGYQVFVVEDAVCSRNPANHGNALARLRQAGVIVTNTESVLFEWLRDARHGHFKAVSALIK